MAEPRREWEDLPGILPHRPPFLFVDRVVELDPGRSVVAEWAPPPDAPFFAGHFPGRPIVPGVLVTEALAQASGILLGLSERDTSRPAPGGEPRYYLAEARMKYLRPARPGETVRLRAVSEQELGGLFRFRVEATAGGDAVAAGSLVLARQAGPRP
jgi:3-hydroxyacyl-[acyl-carrier-protein] dehydratase